MLTNTVSVCIVLTQLLQKHKTPQTFMLNEYTWFKFYFIRVFFYRHYQFTGEQGKGEGHLNSSLPLTPTHKLSDIYLQLWKWDDHHIFLVTPVVITRLLLDEIYPLREIPFRWLMVLMKFWLIILDFVPPIWHEKPVDLNSHRSIRSRPNNQVVKVI